MAPSAEHQMLVDLLRAQRNAAPDLLTVEEERTQIDGLALIFPVPEDVTVTTIDADGVPCEWIEGPEAAPDTAVLFLHGGAYTHGSLTSHRNLSARIARASGARVLAADYRVAPEHPHPAALDDAMAVYRWLRDTGLDASRIVVAGDSAGGGLSTATLVALRDAGDPMPAGAILLSPWLDLTLSGESIVTAADSDVVLTPASLDAAAAMYAGDLDRATPLISPLFASPAGLPPLLVLASTADILVDDARRFVASAEAAGVEVDAIIEPDLIHDWFVFAGSPEAEEAVASIAKWISARLA